MEIQVGEYVRSKFKGIGKVIEVTQNYCRKEDGFKIWFSRYDEIKHSFNIIDLIEEGDYVNGERIAYITISKQGEKLLMTDGGYILQGKYQSITSIVTKEQFESIKYEV